MLVGLSWCISNCLCKMKNNLLCSYHSMFLDIYICKYSNNYHCIRLGMFVGMFLNRIRNKNDCILLIQVWLLKQMVIR